MYEIELKAHVYDKNEVIKNLETWGTFQYSSLKKDIYWQHPESKIQIRLREEKKSFEKNFIKIESEKSIITTIATYKQKKIITDKNTGDFEVNNEHEFSIDNPVAFETFLSDAGFSIASKKTKQVVSWKYENALIELCNVPPLGDFLEIEIIEKNNTKEIIEKNHKKLISILLKCGISTEHIENRFYSEMLKDVKS